MRGLVRRTLCVSPGSNRALSNSPVLQPIHSEACDRDIGSPISGSRLPISYTNDVLGSTERKERDVSTYDLGPLSPTEPPYRPVSRNSPKRSLTPEPLPFRGRSTCLVQYLHLTVRAFLEKPEIWAFPLDRSNNTGFDSSVSLARASFTLPEVPHDAQPRQMGFECHGSRQIYGRICGTS
jgi:hypothetical protein